MPDSLFVLNGPNLNLLGMREPAIYGRTTLDDVERICRQAAERRGFVLHFRQSNHEGEMVESVHEAATKKAAGLIINAGASTHTPTALREAVRAALLSLSRVT